MFSLRYLHYQSINYSLSAAELNIDVQEIHETRSTNKLFNRLNVTLKASGLVIEKSAGVLPIKINSAYCDKDTFLEQLKGITEQNLFQFSNIDADHTTQQILLLTSPNRSNQKLFLEGEVTVYTPQISSRVTISGYQTKTKKRIKNKILDQNGIIVYVFRKNEYDELLLNAREIEPGSLFNNSKAYNVLLDK